VTPRFSRCRALRSAPILALVLSLIACGGGGGGAAVPQGSGQPGAGATNAVGTLTIAIKIPGTDAPLNRGRRPRYVSPATKSIAVVATPTGGAAFAQVQNLTVGSPGCQTSLVTPLICTVTLSLPPGTYAVVFTTYDATFATIPAVVTVPVAAPGNVLSVSAATAVTIAAGQQNTFNATLNGVPTAIVVAPVDPLYVSGDVNGLTVASWHGGRISVTATDAANDFIVGTGTPNVTVSGSGYAIGIPDPAAPNVFTLPAAAPPSALSITVTQGTTTLTGSVPLAKAAPTIVGGNAISIAAHGTGSLTLAELGAPTYTVVSAAAGTATAQLDPSCTTCAAAHQTRFTLSGGTDGIVPISFTDPGGTSVTAQITVGAPAHAGGTVIVPAAHQLIEYSVGGTPTALAVGPDGGIWYLERDTGRVGHITNGTVAAEQALSATPLTVKPEAITVAGDGRLWISSPPLDTLYALTTTGIRTAYALEAGTHPGPLAATMDAVWFTRAPPPGGSFPYATLVAIDFFGRDRYMTYSQLLQNVLANSPSPIFSSEPTSLAYDGRDLFVAGTGSAPGSFNLAAYVGEPAPTFGFDQTSQFGGASSLGGPTKLASHAKCGIVPAGNAIADRGDQYVLPGPNAGLAGVDDTSGGECWFTERTANKVGHYQSAFIATGGVNVHPSVVEYSFPGAQPGALVIAPDGAVWFAEEGKNAIGRFTP
jgi:streptogramin lyase